MSQYYDQTIDRRQCTEETCVPVATLFARTTVIITLLSIMIGCFIGNGFLSYVAFERATTNQKRIEKLEDLSTKINEFGVLIARLERTLRVLEQQKDQSGRDD